MADVMQWVAGGCITPHISHRFPLDRANEAMATLLGRGAKGKVLVVVRRNGASAGDQDAGGQRGTGSTRAAMGSGNSGVGIAAASGHAPGMSRL
jgi:hypothetical protein